MLKMYEEVIHYINTLNNSTSIEYSHIVVVFIIDLKSSNLIFFVILLAMILLHLQTLSLTHFEELMLWYLSLSSLHSLNLIIITVDSFSSIN